MSVLLEQLLRHREALQRRGDPEILAPCPWLLDCFGAAPLAMTNEDGMPVRARP